jgi:hypothetical protein
MYKRVFFFIAFLSLILSNVAIAQTEATPRKKVAVFAPLYLDSAFNAEGKYRFATSTFPKFLNPGIEFYEGAKYAMDSLQTAGDRIEFYIFDSKARNKSIKGILNSTLFDSIELIITHCNASEAKLFAEAALKRNVPVINTNLPNDANAISNPFWIILNPTLRTQCEGVYKLMQKYYSLDQIIVFRKKGALEDWRHKDSIEIYRPYR